MKSAKELFGSQWSVLYREKLQRDEWKNFARSSKESAGHACKICKRGDLPLNVHHIFYDPEREPWDYLPHEIVVLCRPCHEEFHKQINSFRRHVMGGLTPNTLRILNGALAVGLKHNNPLELVHALAEFVSNPDLVKRYAAAWK